MKKIFIFITIIALIFGLAACSSEPETIEGYWMAENGETVSFNSDGKAIIGGISLDYSIYNENNLSISFLGFAEEFRFDIENDVLTLADLSDNSTQIFYRNEDKQAEIQENLNRITAEQAEQERIQQELEAQAQARENYEKYVTKLKNRIDSIDKEILRIQGYISNAESYIADSKENIQEEHNNINDLENEIVQLQYSSDETTQGDIDYLRDSQECHYENIDYYNEEIEYYNKNIAQYKEEIADLKTEKAEIMEELKELGKF